MSRNTDQSTEEQDKRPYQFASIIKTTREDPVNEISVGSISFEAGIVHDGNDYTVMTDGGEIITITTETAAILQLPDVMSEEEALESARSQAKELAEAIQTSVEPNLGETTADE